MSHLGRHRILDAKKKSEAATLVSIGLTLTECARYVGCSVMTLRREMARDDEFARDIESAEVRAQIEAIRGIRGASSTHWRAAAWYLERTNPRRFGRPSLRNFRPDEIAAVFDAVISAVTDEVDDIRLRERICRRLTLAGIQAARALESDRTRVVDPASVIPVRKTAHERRMEAIYKEIEQNFERSQDDLVRQSQAARHASDDSPGKGAPPRAA